MMKVLVPTAVLSSIPRKTVNTTSIIMPPPVPTKPVPKPIVRPKNREIAVAWYAPVSPEKEGHRTIRIGTITVAADKPASPVPIPAPREAMIYQNHSIDVNLPFCSLLIPLGR